MAEAGRPTELTLELTTKIRRYVLDGWEYIKIQAELGIPSGTWDHWVFVDYQGFRTNLRGWKQEKMIKKAENVVDALTDSTDEKIKLDSAKFILESLDKGNYSKRSELSGPNGKDLVFKWQDDSNHSIQTEEVGAGVSPEPKTVDSASVAPESGEDDCNP
jgi:hypothetical protein